MAIETAKELLKTNRILFVIFALWQPENISDIKLKVINFYQVLARIIALGTYVLPQLLNAFLVFGDIPRFAESTFVLSTIMLELIKSFAVWKHQKDIKELINDFDDDDFNPRSKDEFLIYRETYGRCNKMFWSIFWLYNSTVLLWGSFPFLDESRANTLPISAWYPFSVTEPMNYKILFVQQCLTTSCFATLDCCLDTSLLFLIIIASIKADILLLRLRNGYAGYLESRGTQFIQKEDSEMEYLKECAIQHERLIK